MKYFESEKIVDYIDNFIEKIKFLKRFLEYTRIRDNREKFSKLRTIYINNTKPVDYIGTEPLDYKSNLVVTSKYTWLTFLPKNLYEQFRRIANFYFLINIIIIWVLPDPPTSPYTSALPLLIVITITAIKQAYEDIIRRRSDTEINLRTVRVIRDGRLEKIKWREIKCGDVVQVKRDRDFPCDLILLYSSNQNGTCHIKTANLDGETNLKQRYIPNKFPTINNEDELVKLTGVINCEKPNNRLHEFKGTISIGDQIYTLQNDNLLLRGTTLKVAKFVYGCAIYTGMDTKMMKNSKFQSNKLSCVEKKLNHFVFLFIILLLSLSTGCLVGAIINEKLYHHHWYLFGRKSIILEHNPGLHRFITFIFYLNLNNLVPLSLYITLEFTRFLGSRFFEWDLEMFDEKTQLGAKVNSTDLNEDLGQVEYLFSDKTGTLTENQMVFKHFNLNGNSYEEVNGKIIQIGSFQPESIKEENIQRFLEILSLCHTVQVDEESTEKYTASSPDELSFIKFCLKLNISYEGDYFNKEENKTIRKVIYNKTKDRGSTSGDQETRLYELHHVLEFDSIRKRMSVIIKDCQTNQYILFTKGADVAVFKNTTCNTHLKYTECLKTFSENGWRTLVLAYRILSEAEFQNYDVMLNEANNDILNRDMKLNKAYELIEKNLRLIGVTAVEDKLQDKVDDTIHSLRKAGIKIWVLTGDKLETAVNISESCKHFSANMKKLYLANGQEHLKVQSQLLEHKKKVLHSFPSTKFAFIIDGPTLATVFDLNLEKDFAEVSMRCDAVLCCRMSPGQKAQIVKLIKESKSRPMTAAIGDGANDVSMIQEAHVGIGIFGKEGRNAARAADFAFARFKFLKRALLVHGYLYYTRTALLVLYFFYKNLIFAICQTYYAAYNGFSSTSLYSPLFISFYNIALTGAPVLIMSLLEKRYNADELLSNPFIYVTIARNKMLSFLQFTKWNLLALWHSLVCFFLPLFILENSVIYSDGKTAGLTNFGEFVIFLVFLIVHVKIFIIWRYQTIFSLLAYSISLFFFILICLVSQSFIAFVPLTILTEDQTLYFTFFVLLSSINVWLGALLAIMGSIIPDIVLEIFEYIREKRLFTKLQALSFEVAPTVNLTSHSSINEKKEKLLSRTLSKLSNRLFNEQKSLSRSSSFVQDIETPKNYRIYSPVVHENMNSSIQSRYNSASYKSNTSMTEIANSHGKLATYV